MRNGSKLIIDKTPPSSPAPPPHLIADKEAQCSHTHGWLHCTDNVIADKDSRQGWLAVHLIAVKHILFSSMFARESSKRVSILDRGTGTKLEGSDQAQTRQPGAKSEPWMIGL